MPSSESTNTDCRRMESKLHLNILRLAILTGTILYLNIINETNCLNQAEQQGISDQQQQQSIGQAATYGSGSDYASLIAGAENLINLGQPVFNNKRARKMSAFMPMRGRKDGRDVQQQLRRQQDQQQLATFGSADGGELLLAGPYQEAEGESSIVRLVGASLNSEPNNWFATGTPAPRQFTNQLRHMLVSGGGGQRAFVPGSVVLGSMQSGDLMQAKPRRAFHPMRGKKSLPISSSFEIASDEIPADFA